MSPNFHGFASKHEVQGFYFFMPTKMEVSIVPRKFENAVT